MPDLTQIRPNFQPIILTIADFIDQSNQIANIYLSDKNISQFLAQYQVWLSKADTFLREKLDASYATQIHTAPPALMTPNGIDPAAVRYWQHLMGNLNVLNSFITELKRASQ